MRQPKPSDCEDEGGHVDWECYTTAMGDYEDEQRDLQIERMWEEGDQIHQQRKDEKDEQKN